jgi:arsenate reductase (glutaredoxin)
LALSALIADAPYGDNAILREYPTAANELIIASTLVYMTGCAVPNTIYGIKNCDTMKKARAWLDAHGVRYTFHDYKVAGVSDERLRGWLAKVGWEVLLNRAGTTFRKLPDAQKTGLTESKAVKLMLAQPSLIKRPVLEIGSQLLVGFRPEAYAAAARR